LIFLADKNTKCWCFCICSIEIFRVKSFLVWQNETTSWCKI